MENSLVITGIGSRETPQTVLEKFEELGAEAREREWWVRSGHADGADYAFEKGAQDHCIVYMPWATFNSEVPVLGVPRVNELREEVLDIVYQHEPYAEKLSNGVKLIKSRNVYQVLGEDLQTPSDLVICWTDEGQLVGGTALAIKIATAHNIPVINIGDPEVSKKMDSLIGDIVRMVEA